MRENYMSILDCIIMLLIDCVLYFFLALYLDKVVPGEFGRTKSPFFFLKPSFWKKNKKNVTNLQIPVNLNESDFEVVDNELSSHKALK